jgi:two-component system, sensor histidine kinase
MRNFYFFKWLKNISIAKKLYFIIGTMAVLILIELAALWFSIHTLSSVRAFVGAEGLWSKAQKNATGNLETYCELHNKKNYIAFQNFMKVPLGDHKTLLELLKKNPNLEIAREGFLEGKINPDDIDGMLSLFWRFHNISYIKKATTIWAAGDSIIGRLIPIGKKIQAEINSGTPSKEKLESLLEEINLTNDRLSVLEDDFSKTLGEGSRWLEGLILKLLFSIAITVELTGLILSFFVTKGITKGLNEINRAAVKIKSGDLQERANIFSTDEIGQAATSINQMTEQLIQSHKELEAFIYKASHDLKGPLSTTKGLLYLAKQEEQKKEQFKYLGLIENSLDKLDNVLMSLHEITIIRKGKVVLTKIDVTATLQSLISGFENYPIFHKIKISINNQLTSDFYSDEILLQTILRNLLENAIKYSRENISDPFVNITLKQEGNFTIIRISDNGIGIPSQYHTKIFDSFFRATELSKGSGLGLYIVKNALQKLNGSIEIESSESRKGTTFSLFFPLIHKE